MDTNGYTLVWDEKKFIEDYKEIMKKGNHGKLNPITINNLSGEDKYVVMIPEELVKSDIKELTVKPQYIIESYIDSYFKENPEYVIETIAGSGSGHAFKLIDDWEDSK